MASNPNAPSTGGSTVPTSAPIAVHTTTIATARPLPSCCSPWTARCWVVSCSVSAPDVNEKSSLTSPTAASTGDAAVLSASSGIASSGTASSGTASSGTASSGEATMKEPKLSPVGRLNDCSRSTSSSEEVGASVCGAPSSMPVGHRVMTSS